MTLDRLAFDVVSADLGKRNAGVSYVDVDLDDVPAEVIEAFG